MRAFPMLAAAGLAFAACAQAFRIPESKGPCPPPPPFTLEVPPDESFAQIIEGEVFESEHLTLGPEHSNTLVRGNRFIGRRGIRLNGASDVWIVENEFAKPAVGIQANASTASVTIVRNQLQGASLHAVLFEADPAEDTQHRNIRLFGNTVERSGRLQAQKQHAAVRLQAADIWVEANVFCETTGRAAAQLGGGGRFTRNLVRNSDWFGVEVAVPAPSQQGDTLRLDNNYVFGDLHRSAFVVVDSEGYERVEFAFNTALHFGDGDAVLSVLRDPDRVHAVGNLFVFLLDASRALDISGTLGSDEHNLILDSMQGFVSEDSPVDMHLKAEHEAIGFATGAGSAPEVDYDGDPRDPARLDAGADQRVE